MSGPTTPRVRRRLPSKPPSSSISSCPTASGSLFTRLARGFEEWLEAGLVRGRLPIFCGAQAAGCAPVAAAFAAGQETCRPVKPSTIAKSLAIGDPADGPYALELA